MAPDQTKPSPLQALIRDHKRGQNSGIFSICSAHQAVLKTCFLSALESGKSLLIESTCNQVNQDGGYMNMTPTRFAEMVRGLGESIGFPSSDLILGGDHLGPYPWRSQPSVNAIAKARELVADYIRAGYTKIHLDASMPCGVEAARGLLEPELIASRTAELCQAAETAYRESIKGSAAPVYVIGTEVPSPGGLQDEAGGPHVTRPEDALRTIELTRKEFNRRGLEDAWQRVIAIVVHPGVEFGDQVVHPYISSSASALSSLINRFDNLVYEAHSTDYQTPEALKQMVVDHFAILKVGPALTFAYREALFALASIEREWLGGREECQLSNLPDVLEQVMLAEPEYWQSFYRGSPQEIRLALKYSYSDRCRYYWSHPEIQATKEKLIKNLSASQIPPTLISQFMPNQYQSLCAGALKNGPADLIRSKIDEALQPYRTACDW